MNDPAAAEPASAAQPGLTGVEVLRRACASTATVLRQVRPADLDRPTPCVSWKVRDVIEHLIGSAAFFADLAETGTAAGDDDESDRAAGDFGASFATETGRAVAAFAAPGAMDKVLAMPIGDLPGSVCVWIAAGDIFSHGWDLAKATSQPSDMEPDIASALLARLEPLLADAMRGLDGQAPFGPRVDIAVTAPAADRLAAFLGRHP